jgi:hypothetical protein
MSDDFDHAADAMDRLLNGEGEEEGAGMGPKWRCGNCGALNSLVDARCLSCGSTDGEGDGY